MILSVPPENGLLCRKAAGVTGSKELALSMAHHRTNAHELFWTWLSGNLIFLTVFSVFRMIASDLTHLPFLIVPGTGVCNDALAQAESGTFPQRKMGLPTENQCFRALPI